ncbi:hypothetical protein OSG_eHP42_00015 [environmental Halophage eHP-42]|nr:hypothetical protein OSG_eHP42_00015 [environmental Halophage eHP-42]
MSIEHDFQTDVLKVGEAVRSQTADGQVRQRKAVDINGEFQVTEVSSAGGSTYGVALYTVADGEE